MAEQMIRLSGLKLKDKNCPNGDIEITIKNLRPGEKLFEELLIDAKSIPTSHPLIYRANESYIDPKELWPNLKSLEKSLINQDKKTSLAILSKLVPEWFQNSN